MRRFQAALKVGERFYERARAFARSGLDFVPRTQMPHDAGEQTLRGAHRLEREVRDIVADASDDAAYLVAQERPEVDMRENELDALNAPIEAGAPFGKEPDVPARLMLGQRQKCDEKCERDENEDEGGHGSYAREEMRTKRVTSTRSPNFCVASSRSWRIVLPSSLMNGWSRSTWSRK